MQFEEWIEQAYSLGASDLHLEADTPIVARIRGELQTVGSVVSGATLHAGGARPPGRGTVAGFRRARLGRYVRIGGRHPFAGELLPDRTWACPCHPAARAERQGSRKLQPAQGPAQAHRSPRAAWSSFPGPPVRASRPRSQRCSKRSTSAGPATSSRSKARSSTCSPTGSRSYGNGKSRPIRRASSKASSMPCARIRTCWSSAKCARPRSCA